MSLLERLGYSNLGHYGGGLKQWRFAALPFDYGEGRSLRPELRGGRPEGVSAPRPHPPQSS